MKSCHAHNSFSFFSILIMLILNFLSENSHICHTSLVLMLALSLVFSALLMPQVTLLRPRHYVLGKAAELNRLVG